MAPMHAAAIAVALTTLAASPIIIAWLVVRADDLAGYAADAMDRLPGHVPDQSPRHPPIEETAAELRRLGAALRAPVSVAAELAEPLEADLADTAPAPSPEARLRAARWRAELRHEALWISYDEQLREACRALGVPQELDSTVGVELELERLRLADELRAAGLVLP